MGRQERVKAALMKVCKCLKLHWFLSRLHIVASNLLYSHRYWNTFCTGTKSKEDASARLFCSSKNTAFLVYSQVMEHILYVNKVKRRRLLAVFSDLRKTQKILEITLPKFLLHFSIIEESKDLMSEGRYLFTLCWNFILYFLRLSTPSQCGSSQESIHFPVGLVVITVYPSILVGHSEQRDINLFLEVSEIFFGRSKNSRLHMCVCIQVYKLDVMPLLAWNWP